MTALSARQYLEYRRADGARAGVRAGCGSSSGQLSLRGRLQSVSPAIFDKWKNLGGPSSRLGHPRGEQRTFPMGNREFRGQLFDKGTIIDFGAGSVSAALYGGGAGGGAALPETPYLLTLEEFRCVKRTQGEAGDEDEMWLRCIISAAGTLQEDDAVSRVIDYRNNHVRSGVGSAPNIPLYAGSLPETFKVSYMAIEVDLEEDAQQVMRTFTSKVQEKEKLWFSPGSSTIDGILWFNIAMNSLGTSLCVADPNPWVHWIGGVAGTGMEIALISIMNWYKSELIAANEVSFLGENLINESSGDLPAGTGEDPIEVNVYGSSATDKKNILMHVSFSRYDNGDIREERRFFGADPEVDYIFTFRHFLGTGSGPSPAAPQGLNVETETYNSWDPQREISTFLHAKNRVCWTAPGSDVVGYEIQRAANGRPFTKAGTVRSAISGTAFDDPLVQGYNDVYQYRVRAYNKNGFSPYTEPLTVTLPVPAPPYGLSASKSLGQNRAQIRVYWMSGPGNKGYVLERSRANGGFEEAGAVNYGGTGGNFLDTVPAPVAGEVIRYRVKAFNEYGESPYSDILPVTV